MRDVVILALLYLGVEPWHNPRIKLEIFFKYKYPQMCSPKYFHNYFVIFPLSTYKHDLLTTRVSTKNNWTTVTVVKRPQSNADFRDLGRTSIKQIDEISVF